MRPTFFKGAVVGGIAGAVMAGATVALASTTNFLLGSTANAPDALTAVTAKNVDSKGGLSGPMIKLTNNSTASNATALSLVVPGSRPPLVINNKVKVANLNSDWLDGLDSSAFVRKTPPVSFSGSTSAAILSASNAGTGRGLAGSSASGQGIYGHSNSQAGVVGDSTSFDGLWGISHSKFSGVSGHNDAGGYGVWGGTTGTGTGVYGTSPNGRGVEGYSNTWQGVYGHSNAQAGVVGESLNFDGIWGQSQSATHAAISAHNDVWGGWGLWAAGGDVTNKTAAIHGQSAKGNAVEGISQKNTASGVYGQNDSTGYGVAGRSNNGTGVLADSSNGWALNANGNATQARPTGGFVKAMAYVDPFDANGDHVKQCFNSQLPPANATSGDCGIVYEKLSGTGGYVIDFGFKVDDRFVSVTLVNREGQAVATRHFGTTLVASTAWGISVADPTGNYPIDVPFFIILY
jgi:hypothetical protein